MNRAAVSPAVVLILVALACPPLARGQQPMAVIDDEVSDTAPGTLVELWTLRRALLERGDALAADTAEDDLRKRRRLSGVSRSEDLAGVFVLEGHENLELHQFAEAREAFRLALEFDPDMPHAYTGLAQAEWSGGGGVTAALEALWGAACAATRNWMVRSLALVTLLWAGLAGVVAATVLLVGLLLLRTFRLVHHDLHESLQRWLPPATARTLAGLIPFLPLALPRGALWTPLFWLVLVLPLLKRRERAVALALTSVAALAALAVPAATRLTEVIADLRLVQVAGAARGGVGADRQRTLADLVARRPDDAVLQLLLADQSRGLGDDTAALDGYRRAVELDPGMRAAYNNAGAVYFSRGRYATAVGQFRKAIEADPGHMVAHYNLYLTQEHRFDFAAAEQTLAQAQALNLEAITRLLADREQREGRLDVVEDSVPVSEALSHARLALGIQSPAVLGSLQGAWPAAILPVLAMLAGMLRSRRQGYPVCCPSCGRIACRRCALHLEEDLRCATCVTLATRSSSLPRRARESKRLEIQRHQLRVSRLSSVLALLVPGGGQLWSERTLLGALLLTASAVGSAAVLLRRVLPVATYSPVAGSLQPILAVGAMLAVGAWLLGWVLPRGQRPTPAAARPPRR